MWCWHKWSKWSEPIRVKSHMLSLVFKKEWIEESDIQSRLCSKCGKFEERMIEVQLLKGMGK